MSSGRAGSRTPVLARAQAEAPGETAAAWSPLGIDDAFALEELDFVESIRQGREMEMNGEEGRLDAALSFAVLESGLARRAVTVDEVLNGGLAEYQGEIDAHYGL